MKTKRPLFKHLNIDDYTNSDLDAAVNYIENTELSAVRTKYNKKANWEAISIRGYSSDPNYILKPGVLGNEDKGEFLQDTTLKQIPECAALYRIIESIPAEFDRVRVMRLKAGTKISKHTDKIDKSIGFEDGEIS